MDPANHHNQSAWPEIPILRRFSPTPPDPGVSKAEIQIEFGKTICQSNCKWYPILVSAPATQEHQFGGKQRGRRRKGRLCYSYIYSHINVVIPLFPQAPPKPCTGNGPVANGFFFSRHFFRDRSFFSNHFILVN